jgi:cystathionine beta-lyase/cystathionine gamma-synthase
MTEENKRTNQKPTTIQTTESKARRTADKATAPTSQAAKRAAAKADDAGSAVKAGAERSAEATTAAMQTAAKGVEVGRQAVVTASGHVAATAKTAWTVIAHRKFVAAGVGAGLTALSAASYAVGRRAERGTHGPVTRFTGGRI